MKTFVFALALTSACAQSITGTRPNIPATRNEIQSAIDHGGGGRQIVSMGKVEFDRAVVYTASGDPASPRQEVWIKSGGGWQPQSATAGGGGSGNPAIN